MIAIKHTFLVTWKNIDYNFGGFFNGKPFIVPEKGLYFFQVCCKQKSRTRGTVVLYRNDEIFTFGSKADSYNNHGHVNVQTTLELVKNDKIHVCFGQELYNTDDARTTYFEGRLIAKLDE